MNETRLAVLVEDAAASYPMRIDPTFSDADWLSTGGLPGADSYVNAMAVDGSGNLYIGGYFTVVGEALATNVAKWDGSAWSALGAGVGYTVYALAVSGNDL
ncbi:MAG: SBBP repeat-containing protein [Verrucomicrobia bacterium]|nr:SBBP repeat-containing protein [Verrucomicrobiota bacterium]